MEKRKKKEKLKKRHLQDLNLRLLRRSDFESHALDHSAKMSFHVKNSFAIKEKYLFVIHKNKKSENFKKNISNNEF